MMKRKHHSTAQAYRVEFAAFTPHEQTVVDRIVTRALSLFHSVGVHITPVDITMQLSATHAKVPLRLEELLHADDFNFAHDITGIYRHLNRNTGELDNCFCPRFAVPQGGAP